MTQATRNAPARTLSSSTAGRPTSMELVDVALDREIPLKLSRIRLISVVVVLAFAVLTALQLLLAGQALQSAAKDTAQLVRVQNIKVHMLRADALATNAFLVGGLEAPEQRARYNESLVAVSHGIADAAQAQPLDRAVLMELNRVMLSYAEGMAHARSTNRQGLPVGAGYLSASSTQLRERGVVLVDALVQANTERAERSLGAHLPFLVAAPAVGALVVLVVVNQWIARRFHRRINTGVAAAAAVVFVVGVVAFGVSLAQSGANADLREHDYATAVNGSEARSDANTAKTNESLRLVSRGSGQVFEQAWADYADQVTTALTQAELAQAPHDEWEGYVAGHHEVVALDDGGDWDGAVELATDRGPGSSTTAFGGFDAGMEALISGAAERASDTLQGRSPLFFVATGLTILGGLAAAGLVWRGVTARLKEYA